MELHTATYSVISLTRMMALHPVKLYHALLSLLDGWTADEDGWTADEEEAFVEPVPVQIKSPKKVRTAILFYAPGFVTVTVFPLFCTGKRYCCTEN